jgi:hypothetical protein
MGAGVATGPHFPAVVRLARRFGFLLWADRDRPKPCGLILSLSGLPALRIAAWAGPQSGSGSGLAASFGSSRAWVRLAPCFHPIRPPGRNIAAPSRKFGFRSPNGTAVPFGSRFAVPLPEGSGSAGRLSESGFGIRPRAIASRFFLRSPSHFFRGVNSCEYRPCRSWLRLGASFRFRSTAPGHELKVSCFPSRAKRIRPVDKLYIGDKLGLRNEAERSQ